MADERWPPIYNADELAAAISQIVEKAGAANLYAPSIISGGGYCQGDILELKAGVPVLDETGAPFSIGEVTHWLGIGNSCDYERKNVEWVQVVPIDRVANEITGETLKAVRRYETARNFYLPPWTGEKEPRLADLLRPVALSKKAVGATAKVVARMNRDGWVLLHSCLVRFLARDDGRFDVKEG